MTNNLPPEQSKLDREIIDELFEIVPDEWDAFLLTVEPRRLDGDGFAITLLNPDVAGAAMEPTDTIRKAVDGLAAFFVKENRAWERLTYAAHADKSGSWHVKITAPLPPAPAA